MRSQLLPSEFIIKSIYFFMKLTYRTRPITGKVDPYSTFSQQLFSERGTQPVVAFPLSTREKQTKVFKSKQLLQHYAKGALGSGPASYQICPLSKTTSKFNKQPQWKISQACMANRYAHCLPNNPYYQHYKTTDNLKTVESLKNIKKKTASCRFYKDKRFPKQKQTFGVEQFDPQVILSHNKVSKRFSFTQGKLTKWQDWLHPKVSTTPAVSPLTYFQSDQEGVIKFPQTSRDKAFRIATINRAQRFPDEPEVINQTRSYKHFSMMEHYDFNYDEGKGKIPQKTITARQASKIPNLKNKMKSFSIGREKREWNRGYFKNTMDRPPLKVNLNMPKFQS